MYPSIIGHSFGGILILISLIMLYFAYPAITRTELTMYVLLLSIAISAHSLGHAYAEVHYNWNPLEGKFIPKLMHPERQRLLQHRL